MLARWAAGTGELPAEVAQAARRHLLDSLGCLVLALRRDEVPAALAVAAGLGGPPEATLFGAGQRVGAAAAAFGNAVAVHALDFDDTHAGGLVHPSAVVLPVALAVAEQTGASAQDLLRAYGLGLEIACRLGSAAPHGFHSRGLHATSICGVVAAAVAAGLLYRLPAERLADAIGLAASGAGGLLEFLHTGSSVKQVHPGFAAHTAIVAARLAAAAMTGPPGALDGVHGLFAALAAVKPDLGALTGDLGHRWECTRIDLKPYPACRLSHAAIDAALLLRPQLDQPDWAGRLDGIDIEVHADAYPIVGTERFPRTPYEAKFSVRWCVAAMLLDGELTVDAFDAPQRADIEALWPSITCRPVEAAGPAAGFASRVTVLLHDRVPGLLHDRVPGLLPDRVPGVPGVREVGAVAGAGGGHRPKTTLSWQPTVAQLVQAVQGSLR